VRLVHCGCLAEVDYDFSFDPSRRLLTVLRWLPSKRGDDPPRRFSFAPAEHNIRTWPRAYCWTSSGASRIPAAIESRGRHRRRNL
jgi:hypothetical protein